MIHKLAPLLLLLAGCGWFDVEAQAVDDLRSDGGRIEDAAIDGSRDDGGPPVGSGGGDAHGPGGSGGAGGAGGAGGSGGTGMGGGTGGDGSQPMPALDAGCDADPDCDASVHEDAGPPPPSDPEGADLRWHPEPGRFAITYETSGLEQHARAWLLVHGGGTARRHLVGHRLDEKRDNWIDTGIDNVDSELDGVTLSDALGHYQRVFFAHAGQLHMLRADESYGQDGGTGASQLEVEPIPAPSGYTFAGGDVAALTFEVEPGDRRIAVLVSASYRGEPGHDCVFEHALSTRAWAVQCGERARVHAQTDIVGAVVGAEVHFYFRSPLNELVRLTRSTRGDYVADVLRAPEGRPLAQSMAALASELDGRVELIVVTHDGKLWYARPLATSRQPLAWLELPSLGSLHVSLDRAALAAIVTDNSVTPTPGAPRENYQLTELRVIGEDGQLYYTATSKADPDRSWSPWAEAPKVKRDQRVLAIGGITRGPFPWFGSDFQVGHSWSVVGHESVTTLQDAQLVFGLLFWHDHVRIQEPVPFGTDAALAEAAATSGADRAFVAAALRSQVPPARVVLFDSNDGASSYRASSELHALPASDPITLASSALEPTVGYGGDQVHLTTLEWDLPEHCTPAGDQARRIVYRRGATAEQIARLQAGDPNLFLVGAKLAQLDHPVLAVTDGAIGATAHVAFNADSTGAVYYWRLPPEATRAPAPIALGNKLPNGPPVLALGKSDALYVAGSSSESFTVCHLPPAGGLSAADACSDALGYVRPVQRDIAFGAAFTEPQGACAPSGGEHHRCFRDAKPFAIALSPIVAHRVFVAFTADDGGYTSIYLTSSRGEESIEGVGASPDDRPAWLEPVRVNTRLEGDTRNYFDPEIAITGELEAIVTVTFSALEATPSAQPAEVYVVQGEEGVLEPIDGHTIQRTMVGTWDPSALAYDCITRRWALGDYHQPDSSGGRALHLLRDGIGQNSRWLGDYARP